jgi:hypothetical protein
MTPSGHQLCVATVEALWFSSAQPPEARGSVNRHVQTTITSSAATGVVGGPSNQRLLPTELFASRAAAAQARRPDAPYNALAMGTPMGIVRAADWDRERYFSTPNGDGNAFRPCRACFTPTRKSCLQPLAV